jgi:hypothetical protein
MHLAIRALVAGMACIAVTAAAATGAVAVEDLQYEGSVVVGPDGNGWVAARFPTTAGGDDVTYYLDIWTGCGDEAGFDHTQGCPPPVKAVAATLNGEVVFRKASISTVERKEVALNLVGTTDNEIMVSAEGQRGAVARFAIVAIAPAVNERIAAQRRKKCRHERRQDRRGQLRLSFTS